MLLFVGKPTNNTQLPAIEERAQNYAVVRGSKYSVEADKLSTVVASAIQPGAISAAKQ